MLTVRKHGQNAIAECFYNLTTVSDALLPDPSRNLGDRFSRHRVAQRFKNRCAAVQICEYNGGLNAHSQKFRLLFSA